MEDPIDELLEGARIVYESSDPEEEFTLIERGDRGLVFVTPGEEVSRYLLIVV